jgi:hypothetical protein
MGIFLLFRHRIGYFRLRNVVLRKSNWNRPQEEDSPESFFQVESLIQVYDWEPKWEADPALSELPVSWYAQLAAIRATGGETEELPQVQIDEPVSFVLGFTPVPD